MRISRVCLLAVLFAVPAVAQDPLYPRVKIYIQDSDGIPKSAVMAGIQIDCPNCIETIDRGSAHFLLNLELLPASGKWDWTIYDSQGVEYLRSSNSTSLVDTIRTASLRFFDYSEILAKLLLEEASKSKPKTSKPQTPKITKKTTQKTI